MRVYRDHGRADRERILERAFVERKGKEIRASRLIRFNDTCVKRRSCGAYDTPKSGPHQRTHTREKLSFPGKFSSNYKITIGADFAIKTIDWDPQTKINLQLWYL